MAVFIGTNNSERLVGGDEDDLLQGLDGDDTLDGAGGANTLEGGLGDDMFIIRSLADFAVELDGGGRDTAVWTGAGSYVLAANVEDLLVIGDATAAVGNDLDNDIHAIGFLDDDVVAANGAVSIDGAGGDDSVGGSSFDDSLSGGTGDDFLDGGGGSDMLHGGDGDDYLLGEGFSFGFGDGEDRLFGDAGDDILDGFGGDDFLNGGDGADTMLGYEGDDRYNGGAGADFFQVLLGGYGGGADVIEDFTDGEDRILVAFDGLTPIDMSSIESITQDGADTLIRIEDAGSFRLLGVDAALIDVEDFTFEFDGTFEDDNLQGADANDLLKGESGNDRLSGLTGRDELRGGFGADRLHGGDGNDLLIGGAGRDLLSGGKGADIFGFQTLTDGGDTIRGFRAAQGDLIDLSALDANSRRAGDQSFHFADAFSGRACEAVLDYHAGRDMTVLRLDVDGDSVSDFTIRLAGEVTADAGWVL